ncbi:sulfatase [Ornithobacterium rhinotracheale]|uniref:sulfatase n=1 Tax=Ornithobacterium rhinotracheale TaxID=28251 RepID=UPI004035C22D
MNHKKLFLVLIFCFLLLWNCATPPISHQKKKPNILFICIDDLRPELNVFGAKYIHSPHIDSLANRGVYFPRHYVNAPSCGPSRYCLLTGQYGSYSNEALFQRAEKLKTQPEQVTPTLPEYLKENGYTTVAVGKVSHHPGGMGGKDWNDPNVIEMPNAWDKQLLPVAEWEHPRGIMHGLANGQIRQNPADMNVYESAEGDDTIYPDGIITNEALKQIDALSHSQKPFFLAVGIIKPHLPFGAPKKYYDLYKNQDLPPIQHPEKPTWKSVWHDSKEMRMYNLWGKDPNRDAEFANELRKHYAACVSYADAQVGKILQELKRTGAYKNTIIVLWGDHGWNLGEHSIWGKHNLFEEALRSPLIIVDPKGKNKGKASDAIVETIDLFPTLCEMTGLKIPDYAYGTSLVPNLQNTQRKGHNALAYTYDAYTLRTPRYRFTLHKDGSTELFDHQSKDKEGRNIAQEQPALVDSLKSVLLKKAAPKL